MVSIKRQIERIKRKHVNIAEQAVVKTIIDLSNAIILDSPVDTGQFRGRWQLGIDAISDKNFGADRSGAKAISRINSGLQGFDLGQTVFVTNNSPYALVIEAGLYPNPPKRGTYLKAGQSKGGFVGPGFFQFSQGGYSRQAIGGVVGVNVARFRPTFEKIARSVSDV